MAKEKISAFKPQRQNANKHTPRGLGMLDKSMSENGFIGAMTSAADGEIFDGSARLETAYERFGEDVEPIVIDADGTRPIIVRRIDIPSADDPRAKKLAIAANRIASVDLDWDADILATIADEVDISDMFFEDELAALVATEQQEEGTNDPNEVWQGMPEFEQNDADAFKSIKVNFYSLEDLNNFADLVGQKITEKTKYINYPVVLKEDLKAYSVKNES
jgi:hypothetical protein